MSNSIPYPFGYRAALPGLALFGLLATSSFANTLIWNCGGADGNWNSINNWFGLGTPANGDTLIFQGATRLNTTNNIAGLTVNQIQFRNAGFVLYGNAFTLTNSILCTNTVGTNTVACNLALATADVQLVVSNGNNVSLTMSNSMTIPPPPRLRRVPHRLLARSVRRVRSPLSTALARSTARGICTSWMALAPAARTRCARGRCSFPALAAPPAAARAITA